MTRSWATWLCVLVAGAVVQRTTGCATRPRHRRDLELHQRLEQLGSLHSSHDVMFQILGNRLRRKPWGFGWKDTVFLGPDESARCIMRFTDNLGRYVFHCHFLEHEDMRMMGVFR